MIRPTAVEPRDGRRIWLHYSDGASGEVDLSHLADGVFTAWNDPSCFASVHLTDYGAIAWNPGIELCPDALYMRLTGKPLSALTPNPPSHSRRCMRSPSDHSQP